MSAPPDEFDSFAIRDDLVARWPEMPPYTEDYVNTILGDVSQFILDLYPNVEATATARTLTRVTCAVARRAMDTESNDLVGLDSTTEMAGQVSLTLKPSNPHGDFYLTGGEKKALTGGAARHAWSIDLLAGRE